MNKLSMKQKPKGFATKVLSKRKKIKLLLIGQKENIQPQIYNRKPKIWHKSNT
jgi:hypothetical protein